MTFVPQNYYYYSYSLLGASYGFCHYMILDLNWHITIVKLKSFIFPPPYTTCINKLPIVNYMMFQIFHTFVDLGKNIMAINVTHITLDPLQSLLHLDMGFII
jgi:hypothetical protein